MRRTLLTCLALFMVSQVLFLIHIQYPHGYSLDENFYVPAARDFLHWTANSNRFNRSEEHTSELQSHLNLVCRLLLEKKKKTFLHLIVVARVQAPLFEVLDGLPRVPRHTINVCHTPH